MSPRRPRAAGALLLPLALLASGFSPLEAEQPEVAAGNQRLQAGDAPGALERYAEAERAVGPRAEIDFDRGHALLAGGKRAEALAAWKKAAEADARGQGKLASRAWQNMGNALAEGGDQDGALKAFSEALRRDPANEDARYNLEVLQRRKSQGQGAPKDPGQQGKRPQPDQQGSAGGKPEPKPGEAPPPQEPQAPQAQQQQEKAAEPPPQAGDGKDGERREREAEAKREEPGKDGAPEPRPQGAEPRDRDGGQGAATDRREAERILDALRSRERPMPLGPNARGGEGRRDVEKDW